MKWRCPGPYCGYDGEPDKVNEHGDVVCPRCSRLYISNGRGLYAAGTGLANEVLRSRPLYVSPTASETVVQDQPPPTPQPEAPAIQDLVIADIEDRKRVGMERYGTLLKAHNGRDALVDAYQEALDLCMYLRQLIEEERGG